MAGIIHEVERTDHTGDDRKIAQKDRRHAVLH